LHVKRCLGDSAFKLLQFRILHFSRGLALVAVLLLGSSENGWEGAFIVIGCRLFLD
jgi:hypothetical protein